MPYDTPSSMARLTVASGLSARKPFKRTKKAPRNHVRSAWRIEQFCSGLIPTQSGWHGCDSPRWLRKLRRIPCLHRGFDHPPRGRQSDVTGTVPAPVTSSHSQSDDVMTSPDCVSAGSDSHIILEDQLISRRGSGPPSLHEQPAPPDTELPPISWTREMGGFLWLETPCTTLG